MTDLLPTVTGTPVCGDSTVSTDVSDKGDGEFHKSTQLFHGSHYSLKWQTYVASYMCKT